MHAKLLLAGAAFLTGTSLSAPVPNPATADLANWKVRCFNCYNYATNIKAQGGANKWFAQPGGGVAANVNCANVVAQATADGLVQVPWAAGMPEPVCPAGQCLVALAVDPGVDYHWYRKNADGTWSHKPGQTRARLLGGSPTNAALRGAYVNFCGFFCYTPNAPNLTASQPWAVPGANPRGFRIEKCGFEDPSFLLTDLPGLAAHLPTGPTIPDPVWPDLSQAVPRFGGYSFVNTTVASLPVYARAFQGVVAVFSDLDGTIIDYYPDNNGLESYLQGLENGIVALTGTGCGTNNAMAVQGSPVLGSTLFFQPGSPAPLFFVIAGQSLVLGGAPLPLAPLGCAPCTLVPSLDVFNLGPLAVPIPATPTLVGAVLYAQGLYGGVGPCVAPLTIQFQMSEGYRITVQ